jgi:hypothetical protein
MRVVGGELLLDEVWRLMRCDVSPRESARVPRARALALG